jgi:hypothetical protein
VSSEPAASLKFHGKEHEVSKPDPIEEGCLATIYKRFLAPLSHLKPAEMSLQAWWEWLFHTHERTITQMEATRPFTMPGLLHVAPAVKYQGIGRRSVKAGDQLYMRTDSSQPTTIELEWIPAGRKNGSWFSLSQSEWNQVASCLVARKGRK